MKKILTHPVLIVIACLAGFVTGVTSPELTKAIKPIGEVFLTLLNMCVLPIIICAIISSVGALFNKTKNGGSIKRMLSLYLFFIALSCIIGLACPLGMFKVFHLGDNLGATVGALMVDNDAQRQTSGATGFQSVVYDITTVGTSADETDKVSFFLDQIVAGNIFESLAAQKLLQILTFFSSFLRHAQIRQCRRTNIDHLVFQCGFFCDAKADRPCHLFSAYRIVGSARQSIQ